MAGSWVNGRVAVVTGASRGIGRAAAIKLAGAGAAVVVVSRRIEPLQGLAGEIVAAGGKASAIACDVSDSAQVDGAFEVAENFGDPTILICCAGWIKRGPLEQMALEDFRTTLEVNLTGTFLCAQRAMAPMKRAGEGRIVTFSSLSGVYATEKFPGFAAYNAAKAGVVGLTEGLAVEGRDHNISAICISPGAVDTEMLREANPDLRAGLSAEDAGAFIVALLDDALAPASGANIPLFSNR